MTRSIVGRRDLAVVLILFLAIVGFAIRIGWFCGPVFTTIPAQASPAAGRAGTSAVFFSGDMGFNTGMAPRIARHLADQGIAVVGVNSLTAFAGGVDAGSAAAVVRGAVTRALAVPGTRRVLLIGQSFGANIVLAGAAALPPDLRARVPLIELVVPADTMQSRATPGGVIDEGNAGAALPYARRLATGPVLCIHGETEEDSLCPEWRQANVRTVLLPGDHYLQHDDALVAATLLHGFNMLAGRMTKSSGSAQLAAMPVRR